jgi:hypothetical protein
MFESIELPAPATLAALDDLGLVDAVDTATLVESLAKEVRVAAIEEMYTRQLDAVAGTGSAPPPPHAHAALPSSRRRSRKARKRRNRRR